VHRKIERNIHDIVMAEEDGTGSARTVVVAYGGTRAAPGTPSSSRASDVAKPDW